MARLKWRLLVGVVMPGKKFKEVNSKSVAAKERKAAVKRDEEERKRRQEEDEYWRDDDKHIGRKQDRKVHLNV